MCRESQPCRGCNDIPGVLLQVRERLKEVSGIASERLCPHSGYTMIRQLGHFASKTTPSDDSYWARRRERGTEILQSGQTPSDSSMSILRLPPIFGGYDRSRSGIGIV